MFGIQRGNGISIAFCALLIMTFISMAAADASANLIYFPPDNYFHSVEAGLTYIFLVNLPFDILLLSATTLLVCKLLGPRVGKLVEGTNRFVLLVVTGSVLVAVAGAFIDFYMLFRLATEVTAEDSRYYGTYWLDFDLVDGAIAAILVGLSIYVVCLVMLRMDKIAAVIPSTIIGVANYISWSTLTLGYGFMLDHDTIGLITFLAFLVVPIPLLLLRSWHIDRVRA